MFFFFCVEGVRGFHGLYILQQVYHLVTEYPAIGIIIWTKPILCLYKQVKTFFDRTFASALPVLWPRKQGVLLSEETSASSVCMVDIYFFLFLLNRCKCAANFHGPDCQQTKHSFRGHGYAWFPPLQPCFESRISLEFITEVADGLLLYHGPAAQGQPGEQENFLALG